MKWNIEIIRSARKTLSLQIKPDGAIVVRAPMYLSHAEIDRFVSEKAEWIAKHLDQVMREQKAGEEEPISSEAIHALADEALQDIPKRVKQFASRMHVNYGRITIRNQTRRWGSCSSKGNLNFNCLLMLAPPEIRDYVVVHELAHRKQMNHSAVFWTEVASVLPDYESRELWLKKEGKILLARMRSGRQ